MRPVQFTTPPLSSPPDTASISLRHWALMLGVHGQQVTGTTDASVSVNSVLNTLSGGPDVRVIGLAVVDDDDPVTAHAIATADISDLGYPLIPSTGDDPAPVAYAWAVISVPLRENLSVCGVEITLDVPYLPLPGERLGDEGRDAVDAIITEVAEICGFLGRSVIQIRQLTDADPTAGDPLDALYRTRGFVPALVEEQTAVPVPARPQTCYLPAGYSGRILEGMAPVDAEPGVTDGLCRLLEMFSADLPLEDLVSEPQHWDGARLERVDADTRCTGRTVVWAMVFDGSGTPVAASAFSRDPADSPDVAAQMMTVVHREHRGRGLARAVKNVLLGAARDRGIRRIHTATATGSRRIRALNAEYGADPRARDVYWQKRLGARES
ncbi:GNAT family N-acetyltransferase [Corynebacterium sp. CCM 8835]|uniref:GNAT family N-acetyltransferase n=1 Tax=Corynebacterium antarcticum TaxID=2800405 RepID=A0ABS1FJV8_9CORY|nr:GNAT family N-acetyltransferase [Corynebacterium antarcticum]MCL0244833.1 GNAT family N-acetyltransferase [Corynebacterium antarcticum]MCX7539611.1 GNAT family N-acetyltransferase [Corynebacterium antarcticum]